MEVEHRTRSFVQNQSTTNANKDLEISNAIKAAKQAQFLQQQKLTNQYEKDILMFTDLVMDQIKSVRKPDELPVVYNKVNQLKLAVSGAFKSLLQ